MIKRNGDLWFLIVVCVMWLIVAIAGMAMTDERRPLPMEDDWIFTGSCEHILLSGDIGVEYGGEYPRSFGVSPGSGEHKITAEN